MFNRPAGLVYVEWYDNITITELTHSTCVGYTLLCEGADALGPVGQIRVSVLLLQPFTLSSEASRPSGRALVGESRIRLPPTHTCVVWRLMIP